MASSVAIVSGGLAGLAVAGGAAAAGTAWLRRSPPYTRGSHAEHDPHRRDPLAAALRRGFASLGVTTYLGPDGDLRLERDGDRTLRDLILRPLAARVTAGAGRVYPGHEEPLWLLVELPADDPARAARGYQVLETQLREYAWMLTGWRDDELHPGAVTVVLTGADCPRHLLAAQPDRLAFADGTFADVDSWAAPAGLVPLVSEHWAWRFGWEGDELMPAEERYLLHGLVRAAHADGRRVRFFGIPGRSRRARLAFWRELAAAGVDLIGTRDLGALPRFLRRERLRYAMIGR